MWRCEDHAEQTVVARCYVPRASVTEPNFELISSNSLRIESGAQLYVPVPSDMTRIESLMWSTRSSQPLLPGRLDDTGSGESTRWFPWFVESIRCPCTLFLFVFPFDHDVSRVSQPWLRRSFQVTLMKVHRTICTSSLTNSMGKIRRKRRIDKVSTL